jgi:hypothetical protein
MPQTTQVLSQADSTINKQIAPSDKSTVESSNGTSQLAYQTWEDSFFHATRN